MELIEAIERIGIPGVLMLAIVLGAKVLWDFFQETYWPQYCRRMEREEERRLQEAARESDQWTWIVQEISNHSNQLQRVIERMDRLEMACREKAASIYETQPIPQIDRDDSEG